VTASIELTQRERDRGLALLRVAFKEDFGILGTDLTAVAVAGTRMHAALVARQAGVACGLEIAIEAFRMRGVELVTSLVADGARVEPGEQLLQVEGDAAAVLSAERTALNIVQRLAGTATLTRRYVDEVAGTHAAVLDTRKTIPGMRALQRWAVRCGGGHNHRFGLDDEAMLKDNHIAACGGITPAVARIRDEHRRVRIHVEADTVDQAREAAEAGADVVLLDNMTNDELREAVAIIGDRALTEASGGVTLETIGDIARTGVDRISVGAITHSAPAFDAALDALD
jgi:nicotinate-nucleotide pyrophosphorylase (carboxylating)